MLTIRNSSLLLLYLIFGIYSYGYDLVELRDGWQVYHGRLLSPLAFPNDAAPGRLPEETPVEFQDDMAAVSTWRIRLKLGSQNTMWGVIVPEIFTSYRLFLNGRSVGGLGQVAETPGAARAELGRREYFTFSDDGNLEILLQVANYEVEGDKIRSPLILGPAQSIVQKRLWEVSLETTMIALLILAGLAMLVLPEVVEVLSSRLMGAFLWVLALRISVTGERIFVKIWPLDSFEIVSDLGYLTASLAALLLMMSLTSRYKDFVEKGLASFVVGLNMLSLVIILIVPTPSFPSWAFIFEMGIGLTVVWVLSLPLGLYLQHKPIDALYWLSLAALPVAGLMDLLLSRGMFRGASFLPLGILFFTVGQVVSIAFAQIRSEKEERRLLEELQKVESRRISFLEQYQHHLRTPLHGLLAYLEKMPEHHPEKKQALELHHQLQALRDAVNEGLEEVEKPQI